MIKHFCDKCGMQLTDREVKLSQDESSSDLCNEHLLEYEMENINLKLCPFCGSPAEMRHMKNGQYYPRCTNTTKGGYCLLSSYPNEEEDGFRFEKDAIHVWNRRP
jgi:ribosomal protein L37AE/L43A